MKIRYLSIIGICLSLLGSCIPESQDPNMIIPGSGKLVKITAYADNVPQTKTGLVDKEGGGKSVVWKSGNAISLFFNSGTAGGNQFTTTSNGPIAEFLGNISAVSGDLSGVGGQAFFWGLYPYNETASCDGTSITTTLPANQLAYPGDVADDLLVTVGRSENLSIHFKNACSVIGFTLTQENISKVVFSGNAGEKVAGEFKISFDGSNKLVDTPTENAVESITITPAESTTFSTGVTYYFATLPGSFNEGYSLSLTKTDGAEGTYQQPSSCTLKASSFYTMADKDMDIPFVNNSTQKDYYGDITFNSESELASFYENAYTRVSGNVTISGTSIRTLTNLNNLLSSIQGNLLIDCSTLTSLDGLYELKIIGGDLILKNHSLTSMEGLNSLEKVNGDFTASLIQSFQGFDNLSEIGGSFRINSGTLASFEGLENLRMIKGSLVIKADVPSGSIDSNHKKLGLANLKNFTGLSALEEIEGNLEVLASTTHHRNSITQFDQKALPSFTDFTGLTKLKRIGGNLNVSASSYVNYSGGPRLYNLNALNSFSGLNNLESIGGDLRIICTSSEVGDNYVTASATVLCLSQLSSLDGFDSLKEIGGSFIVKVNIGATNSNVKRTILPRLRISGLHNVNTIGKDIIIEKGFGSLDAFNQLGEIGELTIAGDVDNIIGLNNLASVNKNMCIKSTSLESMEGLANLLYVGGDLEISNYHSSSFTGLAHLSSVNGNLTITSSSYLTEISGFNCLTTINGNFNLSSLSNLNNIEGFSSLQSGIINVSITENPKLLDYTPLITMAQNMSGTWYVANCGYNPTKYQMLHGNANGE